MQQSSTLAGLHISRKDWLFILSALILTILSAILTALHLNSVVIFIVSGAALALLAAVVGQATDQLGSYLGAGATGVLQSALGNLPELFVGIFALRAGLIQVVLSALVGSILGNSLFVLGLAFLIGGLKNGRQHFSPKAASMVATLTLLAVSALIIPTLSSLLHTPTSGHEEGLSVACAIILLIVFVASIPASLKGDVHRQEEQSNPTEPVEIGWPIWLAILVLVGAGVGSAFVSDWFVAALNPAITTLHISQTFTGLIIVALAGNAVENVVGVQFAFQNKVDFAISVILNSSLQVALGLTPVLVLLSYIIGGVHMTLVLAPLLVVALLLTALLNMFITYDGESNWLEGLALVGLYAIIAISFWWG